MTHNPAGDGPFFAPPPSEYDEIDFRVWFRVDPVTADEVDALLQRYRPVMAAALETAASDLKAVEAEPASLRKTSTARRKHKKRREAGELVVANLRATLTAIDQLEPGSFSAVYDLREAAYDLHLAWRCVDDCGLDTCAGYEPIQRLWDDARHVTDRFQHACGKAEQLEGGLYTVARYAPAAVEEMVAGVRARPDVLAATVLPPSRQMRWRDGHSVADFDQLMRETSDVTR